MKTDFIPTIGIDIGSHSVKCVVLGENSRILAVSTAESVGVVRGAVTHVESAAESIRNAVTIASREAGVQVRECYLALGGEGLMEHKVTAEVELDGAVDGETVDYILEEAQKKMAPELVNRVVLHEIPQGYWVDTQRTITAPLSLKGSRLGVSVLYISILEKDKKNAEAAVASAGLEVVESIAAPIASSLVTLTTLQKNAGCLHVLVGRDTTIGTIFEHGIPAALKVFPFGSNSLTEDIALALSISLEEAERLTIHAGTELMKEKKKVLATILKKHRSFANDLRLFIDSKRRVLPAGIVLTGGGGQLALLEEHIRDFMRLPTIRAALPKAFGSQKKHHDTSLTPALGAAVYGSLAQRDPSYRSSTFAAYLKKTWKWFVEALKSLLP
jgi:cell division protein FtsA